MTSTTLCASEPMPFDRCSVALNAYSANLAQEGGTPVGIVTTVSCCPTTAGTSPSGHFCGLLMPSPVRTSSSSTRWAVPSSSPLTATRTLACCPAVTSLSEPSSAIQTVIGDHTEPTAALSLSLSPIAAT